MQPGSLSSQFGGAPLALRHEIKDSGVTVTCLMPGATETEFFERADMLDTKVGTDEKDSPAFVAQQGFDAMKNGEGQVIAAGRTRCRRRSRILRQAI